MNELTRAEDSQSRRNGFENVATSPCQHISLPCESDKLCRCPAPRMAGSIDVGLC